MAHNTPFKALRQAPGRFHPPQEGTSAMISFVKKTDTHPTLKQVEENRFEQIRKAAAERHRKSDTDGTRRRARQKAEDNRLI
ncbi:hypothetical protein P7L70_10030 [Tistrella mobilis]|nr:hypothetical protein [Paracoccus yeei]